MRTSNQTKRLDCGSIFRKVYAILMGTALIASTNLSTAALANNLGERRAAFQELRQDNPGLNNRELRQLFRQEFHGGSFDNGGVNHATNASAAVIESSLVRPDRNDFGSKADFQAARQAFRLQQQSLDSTVNRTVQQTDAGKFINVNRGFALDLTSAVESITLGDRLFNGQDSVTINVGGQTKTLSAGSKVTAAEYVAAKQALNVGHQTVNLDADGRATGGTVDLDAMTAGNRTMKVSDLVVPVDVTASGDFGKRGDVRITGDLTNNGSIVANGGKVTAWIGADNITNNAGASITSNVERLVLDADNAFANYGSINANGSLTIAGGNSVTNTGNVTVRNNLDIYSPNVTNSGNLASTKGNVTFDAIASNMNINNTNGTVSALNGAINIREAGYNENFNTVVNGGDWLSQTLNANAGNGTIDMNVNQLTGQINSSGYAAHVNAATDILTIGNLDLIDPTFKNATGSILINGNISVSDDLTFIARDNITVSSNVVITADNTGSGNGVTMIAGANLVPPGGVDSPIVNGVTGTASVANIDGTILSSTAGGNITFGSNTQINATAVGGSGNAGGNVRLIALQGTGLGNGNITADGLSITTTGDTAAGNVEIFAGGTGTKTIGAINTNNATGADGSITVLSTQAVNSLPGSTIQYAASGELTSAATLVGTGPLTAGTMTLTGIIDSGSASTTVRSGGALTLNSSTSGSGVTLQAAGGSITGNGTVDATTGTASISGLSVTSTGTIAGAVVNLTATTGNIGTSAATRVNTNSADLNLFASNGNIFVANTGATSLDATSSAAGQVAVSSTGTMSVDNNITANNVNLSTTGTSDINVTNGVTVAGNGVNNVVTINAGRDVLTTGTGLFTGNTISLTAGRNVGTNPGSRARVDAGTLTLAATTGSAWVSELNTVTLGASAVSGAGQLYVNTLGGGDMTVSGALVGGNIQLATFTGGSGDILVNSTIGTVTTSNVAITADRSVIGTSVIAGDFVSLTANTGSVGASAASRVRTSSNNLSLSAVNDSIYVSETDGVNLITAATASATGSFLFNTLGAGVLNVNTAVSGGSISITTAGAGSNIVLNSAVGNGSTTNVTLASSGALSGTGSVTATGTADLTATNSITSTGVISGSNVNLTSTAGNIGSSAVSRVSTAATNLTVTAASGGVGVGNAWVSEADGVSVGTSSVNKQFFLNTLATGDISVDGPVTGNDIRLTNTGASNIILNSTVTGTGTSTVILTSGQSIDGSGKVTATTVTLTANNGSIGTGSGARVNTAATNLTLNGTNLVNAYINEDDTVNLNAAVLSGQLLLNTLGAGNITVAGAVSGNDVQLTTAVVNNGSIVLNGTVNGTANVTLSADGSITGNSTVSGGAVNLSATNGSIGTNATTRVSTASTNLTANAANGSVFINEAGGTTLGASSASSGGTFQLSTVGAGDLVVNSDLSSANVLFTVGSGNFNVGNGFTVGSAGLSTTNINASGNISTGALAGGGSIAGNAVTLTAGGTVGTNNNLNRLDLQANTLTVSGAQIFVTDVGGLNLNATTTAGSLEVSTSGTININGALNGSVIVLDATGAGSDIAGAGTVTATTSATYTAANSITATGNITSQTVSLTATAGSVGQSAATRVRTTADTLTANAANGDVFINEQDDVTLNASGAATGAGLFILNTLNAGTLSVNGALTGDNIQLTTTGSGSNISTTANGSIGNIATTSNVALVSGGSITTNAAANGISGNNVSLTATAGNIGTGASAAFRAFTNADTLTLVANSAAVGQGNVWVTEANGVAIQNSTANKEFRVNTAAAGNMSVDGTIGANNIQLATFGTGANNISINNNITGTGTSTINVNSGDTGVINGAGNVTGTTVTLVGGGGISATGVVTGTDVALTATTGNIGTLGSRVNTSATNLALTATAGSAFINEANGVNLNGSTVLTTLALDTLAGGTLTVAGPVATSANGNVLLTTAVGGNGSVVLNNTVTGGSTAGNGVSISADGSITGTSTLTGNTVSLTATNGAIGTTVNRVSTNATNLQANALAGGNVFVNDSAATVNLGASSGGQFEVTKTTAGSLNLTGTLTATNAILRNNGANSGIALGANTITGLSGNPATAVTLIATGSGAISATAGHSVNTGTLTLTSGSGNIGSGVVSINTSAGVLSANTAGSVFVTDTNTSGVTLNASSASGAGQSFSLTNNAGGNIAINGSVTSPTINLTTSGGAGSISRNGASTLNATTAVNLTSTGDIGTSVAPLLTNTAAVNFSVGAGRNAFIQETDAVTVVQTGSAAANVGVTAAGNLTVGNLNAASVVLTTTNSGNIIRSGAGVITATNLTLASDLGDIGTGGARITTTASNVSANTLGNVFLNGTNTTAMNLLASSGNTFDVFYSDPGGGAGSLVIAGPLSANTILLESTNNNGNIAINSAIGGLFGGNSASVNITTQGTGSISTNGALISTNAIDMNAGGSIGAGTAIQTNASSLDADANATVSINDTFTGTVQATSGNGWTGTTFTLTTAGGVNLIDVDTTTFNLNAGGNVLVGGAITSPTINITTTNNGNITLSNNIVSDTVTNLTAGGSGSIIRTAGTITGTTFILNMSSGTGNIGQGTAIQTTAGTISANTAGNVAVTQTGGGALTLNSSSASNAGSTFTLTSDGDITVAGALNVGSANISTTGSGDDIDVNAQITAANSVSLDVSNGATGGAIDLNAGITAGNQVSLSTNLGAITASGAGSLISTNSLVIQSTTGAVGATGAGNNVATDAASITVSTGNLTTSDVFVTATRAGLVNVLNLSGNNINLTGSGVGNTLVLGTIAAAGTGNSVSVTQNAGTNGAITLTNNVSSTGNVTLSANGVGAISRTGGTVSANVLTMSSGSGDIGVLGSAIETDVTTLAATTAGDVYVNEANALGVNNSQGSNFNLVAGGAVTINDGQTLQGANVSIEGASIVNDGTIRGIGGATTRANSVNLTATTGNITRGTVGTDNNVLTNSLSLTTNGGNVGVSAATAFNTNATSITANTGIGDIFISDNSTSAVSLNGITGDDINVALTSAGVAMNVNGAINSSNTLTIATTGAGAINVNSAINGTNAISLTTGNGGAINLGESIFGNTTIGLTTGTNGNINQTNSSAVLSSDTVNLTAGAGGRIGTSIARVNTSANTLSTAASGGTGNVFINEADAVILADNSTSGATFDLVVGGDLTINNVSANGGLGTVKLTTSNGGNIIRNGATTVTAANFQAASDFGSVGSSGSPINTTAGTISANTLGDVYITSTNGVATNVGQMNGSIIGLSSNNGLNLLQNVNGSSSVSLTTTTGGITQAVGRSINTQALTMTSTSGSIGSITTNAATLAATTSGTVSIVDTYSGPILLNALSGGTVTVNATGVGNTLIVNSALTGLGTLNLLSGPGTNGAIAVNNSVTATTVNLTADGSGTITNNAGLVNATTLNLASGTGNIGTAFKNVTTNAANISVNTDGDVYVNDVNGVGITLTSSTGKNFNLRFSSNLTVTGGGNGIFADKIVLTGNSGSNAGVLLQSTGLKGLTSVVIHADGTGNIFETGGILSLIDTPTVVLTSGDGDIGQIANPIFINATNVTATTTGSIYLSNINNGPVNLGPLSGTDFFYTNNGTINVVGVLDFTNDVTLITNNNSNINLNASIIAGGVLTLTANGIGNITQAASTLLATPTLVATSGGGNIGTATNHITTDASTLTVNTGGLGSVWVDDINSIQNILLVGQNGAGQTFNLTVAGGPGLYVTTALGAGNFIEANTANITSSNGSIGNTVLNPLVTNVGDFSANAISGSVVVFDQDSMNVTAVTAGGNVVLAAQNNLSTSGPISATGLNSEVVLGALNGALDINSAVSASKTGLLSGATLDGSAISDATLNSATIAFVSLNGDIDLDLAALAVTPNLANAAFDADQGSVTVVASRPTLNLRDISFASLSLLGPGLSTATNQSNGYDVSNAGSLNVVNAVDGGTGAVQLNTSLGGVLTITATGSTTTAGQTILFGQGGVFVAGGGSVTSTGSNISISGAGVSISGTVQATNSTFGSVGIQANAGDVLLGSFSSVTANQSTGNALTVSSTNNIDFNGNVDAVGSIDVQPTANFSAGAGSTTDSTAGSITVNAGGTSSVAGSITANTTVGITSVGTNTVLGTGSVSGTTVSITSSGADLQISGNISGGTAINLSSHDDLLNANISGGTFLAPQLNLTSTAGSIGASGDALDLQATVNVSDNLSMTANAGTDVYVTYDGASLTIGGGKSSATGTFDVENTVGSLSVTGGIDPTVVNLTSASTLDISSLVTASSQINLTAEDDITTSGAGLLQAPSLVANSNAGSIGTSIFSALNTDVDDVSATAANNVYVSNATKSLNIVSGSAGGDFVAAANGNLTSTGTITGDVVGLAALGAGGTLSLGNTVTATTQIGLVADGDILNGDFTLLDAPTIAFASSTGNIGAVGDALVLNSSNTANLTTVAFDADGAVRVAADLASVTLNDINFFVALTATNNANNGTFTVSNTGNIVVAAATEADGSVSLTSSAGQVNINATVDALTTLTVHGSAGVTSASVGDLTGDTLVQITTDTGAVSLSGDITATGQVNIDSGASVAVNSGATISGNLITTDSATTTTFVGTLTGTGVNSEVAATSTGLLSANGSITAFTIGLTSTDDSVSITGSVNSSAGGAGNSVSVSAFNDITGSSGIGNISAESLSLKSTDGSVGTDFIGGEIVLTALTNLTVNAAVDSFIRINSDVNLVGTNVVGNGMNFGGGTTGGSLTVTGTVNAAGFNTNLGGTNGGDLIIASTGSVTADSMNLFTTAGGGANGDVTVSGVLKSTNGITFNAPGDVTTTGLAFIEADFISFNAANIDVTTKANGASVVATGATGATIVNSGNFNLQSATVTNTLDVSTDATVGGDITVSGSSTADVLNLTANSGTLPANGDIILDASINGTTSVTLTADGGIQDNTNTIGGASVTLNASGGNIVANLSNGAAAQSVTINAGTFDSTINYTGTNTLTMLASSGDQLTVTTTGTGLGAGASFAIGGDSTFNGDIDITTNNMTNAANVLTSTTGDINIQSFAGSGLILNGGVDPVGGSYSAGGAINVRATANNLVLNGTTTYLTSANLFGNGPGQAVVNNGNQRALEASFIFTANDLGAGTYTAVPPNGSWNLVNSGTYANSDISGDVNISADLIFSGSNLAIIAAGDINFIGGPLSIFLNGAKGGNLTMIAGYNFAPPTNGQIFNNTGAIFQSFQNTGTGSITGGVNINTSGTSDDGGNVLAIANGGSISIGSIVTSSTFANGGSVTLIGSTGVSVGNIVTTGTSSDGNVTLAVANSSIPTGTGFQVQNGTVITGLGSVAVGSITNGDLVAGNINAGAADVTVFGARLAGNQLDISNGVTADSLTINTVNGIVTANTTVNTLNSNSTGTAAVTLSNDQALTLGTVTGANQSVNLTVSGAFDSSSAFTVNGFTVSADSIDLSSGAGTSTNGASLTSTVGDITGTMNTGSTTLTLDSAANVGTGTLSRFNTDAAAINLTADTAAYIDSTSTTGVAFGASSSPILDVTAAQGVSTTGTLTSGNVTVTTGNGQNAVITLTNGVNPVQLTLTTGAGDATISYSGTSTLTLNASTGDDLTITNQTSSGAIATGGAIVYSGDITLNTNTMTNAFSVQSTGGDIKIASLTGDDLFLVGGVGPTGGTYSAGGVISATTNGTVLDITGVTTYLTTASLFANQSGQSINANALSDSIATVSSFLFTGSVTGTGTFTGPWNIVNSGTYANNGGNVTLGSVSFSGADLAILASGNINLGTAVINLSGTNGGNLTMLAGFDFQPNGVFNQDTTTTFDNFTATSTGSITGTATINLNGTGGTGGNLVALANAGSVSLGNISATGTTVGGNVTITASNGITTGSINTTGVTGGDISITSGSPSVGGGTTFQIKSGSIITGANTIGNSGIGSGPISVGNINAGNGSFSAVTTSGGSITASAGISAHDITLQTGTLTLTTVSNLTSNVDAGGNAGSIVVSASTVDTAAVGDILTFVANGAANGDGGVIDFTFNNAAAVTLGTGGRFQFSMLAAGNGDGGTATYTSTGNVTIGNGAFVGDSVGGNGGGAVVNTTQGIAVQAGAFDLAGALDGATISLTAGGGMDLASGIGFFTQANAVGANSNGGELTLSAASYTLPAGIGTQATPLALTATGNGTGDGGKIFFRTNSTVAMMVGTPAKAPKGAVFYVSADASGGGDGGDISLLTGGNLTVNANGLLDASGATTGGNFDGASYTLTAGVNGALGNLIVSKALNGSAVGSGVGGDINLSSRSATAFTVNSAKAPKNGTFGTITTTGTGEVNITNFNGGITLVNQAAVTARTQHYTLGGAKGAFLASGVVVNALDELSIISTGAGAIGGKAPIVVNTADLTLRGNGTVGVTNNFAGTSVLQDSFAGKTFTLNTANSVTLNDITTGLGNMLIKTTTGTLNVASGAVLNAQNGSLTLQNVNNTSGQIVIGDLAQVKTTGTGKNVIITLGATVPKTGTNPAFPGPVNVPNGVDVVYNGNTKFNIFWGTPNGLVVSTNAGGPSIDNATVESKNASVIFNGTNGGSIVLGKNSYVLADPPDRVSAPSVAVAAPAPVIDIKSVDAATKLFAFVGENTTATSDLSVLNMNAAPQAQVANNATLITATNTASLAAKAGLTVAGGAINAGAASLATLPVNSTVQVSDEDNSYMVGFMGNNFGETEAAICSDAEIGMTEGAAKGVQTIQHGERVVIKKGNVLFVPFKATTVETPNGIVHIDAKAVALVSSTEAGLAVYDLEDQHKGSVSVESNGHNVVLSPGRHVMVTKHHTAEFAQINAVETIAHRNVQSTVKNGHRAHTSEFSVLTAMDTVKPLKALAMSKHANAKQIADRMMKTTAIILQLGGGAGQYQHYFKPRMTAMQK